MTVFINLETFLRGMETRDQEATGKRRLPALKPSLEGWKRMVVAQLAIPRADLETFLRGMETRARRRVHHFSFPLKPSLEG